MDDGATNTQSAAGTNRFALPIFIERFCIRISLGPPVNRHKEQSWYPAEAKGPHGLTRSSNSFSKNPSTMCELMLPVVVSIQPTARKAGCLSNGKKSNGFRSSIPDKATSSRTNGHVDRAPANTVSKVPNGPTGASVLHFVRRRICRTGPFY